MSKIGYALCTTDRLDSKEQEAVLRKKGCEKCFIDKCDDEKRKRTELQAMISFAREGDTVYVDSIPRLARNTHDLLVITEQLLHKNVALFFIEEKITTSGADGKKVVALLQSMSSLDKSFRKGRQSEGISDAKKNGKYKGRQPIQYDKYKFDKLYDDWKDGLIKQKYICDTLGMSLSTVQRLIKKETYNREQQKRQNNI